MPSKWCHEVISLDPGVSLSTNFLAESHAQIVISNMAAALVLNQNQNIEEINPKARFVALMKQRAKLSKLMDVNLSVTRVGKGSPSGPD